MQVDLPDPERKERERSFHNDAFAGDKRAEMSGFYAVTRHSAEAFSEQILARARDSVVLEYGCGPGTYAFQLAKVAKKVVGIDISDVAIEIARGRAISGGFDNTEFHTMDAEALSFADASFDLVCGRAIIHHLDVNRAFSTISRVLKPGGCALFYEPLGHNPAINFYRSRTPEMRTIDEHPLLMSDVATARRYFRKVSLEPFVLLALLAYPVRGTKLFDGTLRMLDSIDRLIFKIPGVGRMAWTSLWLLEDPIPAGNSRP